MRFLKIMGIFTSILSLGKIILPDTLASQAYDSYRLKYRVYIHRLYPVCLLGLSTALQTYKENIGCLCDVWIYHEINFIVQGYAKKLNTESHQIVNDTNKEIEEIRENRKQDMNGISKVFISDN
ncbi:MAG: hypothetical protein SOR57_09455 [Parabacteroides sp.]|nr:hypothetical protein [Parabacteroides sp.]